MARPIQHERIWAVVGIAAIFGFVLLAIAVVASQSNPTDYQIGWGYYLSIDSATYVALIKRGSGVLGFVSPKVIYPLTVICALTGTAWIKRLLHARRNTKSRRQGLPM